MAKRQNNIFEDKKNTDINFVMDDDEDFKSEDRFQYCAYRWATDKYPELREWSLFSYPAGGLRLKTVASTMKSTGQKAGLPDLFFILRSDFMFFIELKIKDQKPKPKQLECHEYLRFIGFRVYVIDNPKEFKRVVDMELTNFRNGGKV